MTATAEATRRGINDLINTACDNGTVERWLREGLGTVTGADVGTLKFLELDIDGYAFALSVGHERIRAYSVNPRVALVDEPSILGPLEPFPFGAGLQRGTLYVESLSRHGEAHGEPAPMPEEIPTGSTSEQVAELLLKPIIDRIVLVISRITAPYIDQA